MHLVFCLYSLAVNMTRIPQSQNQNALVGQFALSPGGARFRTHTVTK